MSDDLIKKIPVVSAQADTTVDTKTAPTDGEEDPFDDVKKELRSRYELLPDDIKQTITDDGYQMKLFNLAKDQKYTYDELGIIELETTMVLLGMVKPADFRDELQMQLKKNDTEIDFLVREINTQVFDPIRASLDKIFSTKKEPLDYITGEALASVGGEASPKLVAEEAAKKASIPTPAPLSVPFTIASPSAPTTPETHHGLSETEKSVLESSGVVIHEQTPLRVTPQTTIVPPTILSSTPKIATSKVTDYSVAKPTAPQQTAQTQPNTPAIDPYRESIT